METPSALNLVAIGVLGLALWRGLAAPRLRPLPAPTGPPGPLLALFLVGWLGTMVVFASLAPLLGDGEVEQLGPALALQTGANLAAVALVLLLAQRLPGGPGSLGLGPGRRSRADQPRHRLGLDPPAALAAWLMALPILATCAWINQAVLRARGLPVDMQDHLARFLAEGGAASPWVWVAMVLVIPLCEEVLFRGAFYGGLRRALPPWAAMLVTGLVFGAAHDQAVMLPVAALGVVLAWLYERTGSLAAPTLMHGLQNLATLSLATYYPELLT